MDDDYFLNQFSPSVITYLFVFISVSVKNYTNIFVYDWFLCFNGISTFVGYLMPKPFSLKNSCNYLTHSWEDKGVQAFTKSICPNVNVIARLEDELTHYDSVVHRFNQYTTRTSSFLLMNIYM